MAYNLTETQKKLARFLVEQVQAGNLPESFNVEDIGFGGQESYFSLTLNLSQQGWAPQASFG